MVISSPLAIHGGPSAIPAGPPSWPLKDDDVQLALRQAGDDGSWGRYHGPHVERLEQLLMAMHQVSYSLTCCSGTIAVELALRGLKIGAGDEVLLAGYDFGGNFRCIESVGAFPVLVDIDPQTWSMSAERIENAISSTTRAILVSHLHGGNADMRKLCALASKRGLRVLEDACQVPGAIVQGRPAGTWGDVGVLSFGGSKLLTAGRGGAIVTAHEDVFQRIKIYCERGNHAFPLSELQAAVLAPQIGKLDTHNATRQARVKQLLSACQEIPALSPVALPASGDQASYYKVAWRFDPDHCGGWHRAQFVDAMQAEGVAIDVGFRGFLRRSGRRCRKPYHLEYAQKAVDQTVLLHHPVLLENAETINRVRQAISKVVDHAASNK
jgi:dTDP-4-amino-4,6-dideoxygalactose transaminase